jgi:hypothetical protein
MSTITAEFTRANGSYVHVKRNPLDHFPGEHPWAVYEHTRYGGRTYYSGYRGFPTQAAAVEYAEAYARGEGSVSFRPTAESFLDPAFSVAGID